jgi:hypothetical protein
MAIKTFDPDRLKPAGMGFSLFICIIAEFDGNPYKFCGNDLFPVMPWLCSSNV